MPNSPRPIPQVMNPVKLPSLQAIRSMRWILISPLVAVVALALLMGATIWYLTESEYNQQQQALIRDVNSAQRQIGERLQLAQNELAAFSEQMPVRPTNRELQQFSEGLFIKQPEIVFFAWIDQRGTVRHVSTSQGLPTQGFDRVGAPLNRAASLRALEYAISSKKPQYSAPMSSQTDVEVDLHVPILRNGITDGTLVASYSLPSLLLSAIPSGIGNRVAFSIVAQDGERLGQTRDEEPVAGNPAYEVPLEPISTSLRLRGFIYKPVNTLYNDVIATLVAGLILFAVISQIVIWRNTRRRLGAEQELAEETAFRRAMENSMSTGMRVIDLSGQIKYVNPAFCRMVGFSPEELTGAMPPYPYWPPETLEQLGRNLGRMLSGESPPSGLPIAIMRKNGTRLTVRMYTSPLIDHTGIQTGWMTSVTDISEQTRIRQELAQSQERFITVLQALDAAVSVAAPAPNGELLFANQAYKKWFGSSITDGHRYLSAAARGPWADVREVYNDVVQRWFEVRVRNIQWVDGRAVELMVATDITKERASQQAQREQHEKLQQTARLVTMGEMASSLAHELNQPLTAIANYTSGAASRIRMADAHGEQLPNEDLIDMLTKTAKQAERAGQVIRRIRGFVKRSDPIRRLTDPLTILADTLGLADIDARERGITLIQKLDPSLPMLNVDPILIEQVLLNLVKNGIEAMRDAERRELTIEIILSGEQIVFSVIDCGHGVPKGIRDRLFDSFYTTKSDGMGMGLNICRSIIESHQGRLWFEDNPDGGCTFRFTLPVAASQPPENSTIESEAVKS
ncbi:MAG: PAS domain S-box protein [Burkholderiaceae bacterium]|nr:PAS domain S-box protein [Burkholderiaceae bacterium]